MEPKLILHLFYTAKQSCNEAKDFAYEHQEHITKYFQHYPRRIFLDDNTEHIFLGEISYRQWCLGRDYYDDVGNHWRSGRVVK